MIDRKGCVTRRSIRDHEYRDQPAERMTMIRVFRVLREAYFHPGGNTGSASGSRSFKGETAMKRSTYAILTGTLAFGLTAAAAAGTAFTINSVEDVGSTDTATISVGSSPCTGVYDIDWSFDSMGFVTGFTATRTAPDPDPNLEFCASMPALLTISNSGTDVASYYGTTETNGDFIGTFQQGAALVLTSYTVALQIGPNTGI